MSKRQTKKKILWANAYCLLDTSSGASMAVRQQLLQLVKNGFEVDVIGCTIFDAAHGITRIKDHWDTIQENIGKVIRINDGHITHHLLATLSKRRDKMTSSEEGVWYSLYIKHLEEFRPDVVYFYGGQTLDLLISEEAKTRGIPAVAYLANGNYQGDRWCRDVDLVLTDSHATANFYHEKDGYKPVPIGAFIDPAPVRAARHERKNLLLVNPSLEKGAGVVVALAMMLEKRRPDIIFEVVESRGNWNALVKTVSAEFGEPRESLENVIVTPNTVDMRPIYGRARLLLALSLWFESFGRVAAEAMMNGIPALVTNRGGLPEVIGDAGFKVDFPKDCYEKPYTRIPNAELLEKLIEPILRIYDDESFYQALVKRAFVQGQQHDIENSTGRMVSALERVIYDTPSDRAHERVLIARHENNVTPKKDIEGMTGPMCLTAGRHGFFMFNRHDTYIGKGFEVYGEYCEHEVALLSQLLRPGQVFWDIGANIGALTIPLARVVGETGSVVAFEPNPYVFHTLAGNVAANNLSQVRCFPYALSDAAGTLTVPQVDYNKTGNFGMVSLDGSGAKGGLSVTAIRGDEIDFVSWPNVIKIDVEGMEASVISGLTGVIRRNSPILYVENDRVEKSKALIEQLWALDYKLFWHISSYFNANNFRGVKENIWPNTSSFNMLCVPLKFSFDIQLPQITDSSHHPLRKDQ